MFKYLYNYITLMLIFLLTDIFLVIGSSFSGILGYLPTITMVGSASLLLLIPYTYLIVKLLFIKKANSTKDTELYLNIKSKLIITVTIINIVITLIEIVFLKHTIIWLLYTVFIFLFLKILKTEKENLDNITHKNIKNYFDKEIK